MAVVLITKKAGEGYQNSKNNALKHGLSAKHVILPGEDPEMYEELRRDYHEEWQPSGPTGGGLVDDLVQNVWMQKRYTRQVQACYREVVLERYEKLVQPASNDGNLLDYEVNFEAPFHLKEPEALFELLFGSGLWHANQEHITKLKATVQGILQQKTKSVSALHKASLKLPLGLQLIWDMALERPSSAHEFADQHGLQTAKFFDCDWPDFAKWLKEVALPYIALFDGTEPVSPAYRDHLIALAGVDAIKKLSALERYETRLWSVRKDILAMLLKLREM